MIPGAAGRTRPDLSTRPDWMRPSWEDVGELVRSGWAAAAAAAEGLSLALGPRACKSEDWAISLAMEGGGVIELGAWGGGWRGSGGSGVTSMGDSESRVFFMGGKRLRRR
jgi:hypothetical protein